MGFDLKSRWGHRPRYIGCFSSPRPFLAHFRQTQKKGIGSIMNTVSARVVYSLTSAIGFRFSIGSTGHYAEIVNGLALFNDVKDLSVGEDILVNVSPHLSEGQSEVAYVIESLAP